MGELSGDIILIGNTDTLPVVIGEEREDILEKDVVALWKEL